MLLQDSVTKYIQFYPHLDYTNKIITLEITGDRKKIIATNIPL